MKNENVKKLVFGCDSAGYALKNTLIAYFKEQGYDAKLDKTLGISC